MQKSSYPTSIDSTKVGTYDLDALSGGGYFYDEVLEYRVWYRQDDGLYCYSTSTYEDAVRFYNTQEDADLPVVLVKQYEHINEPKPEVFEHIKKPRITEWRVEWLEGSRGSREQIPVFLNDNRGEGRE